MCRIQHMLKSNANDLHALSVGRIGGGDLCAVYKQRITHSSRLSYIMNMERSYACVCGNIIHHMCCKYSTHESKMSARMSYMSGWAEGGDDI